MLGKFLTSAYNLPDSLILETYQLSRRAKIPPIVFSHGGPFNLYDYSSYNKLQFKDKFYQDKKVIFLIRDIRDTLVSAYFQEAKRNKIYARDLASFIREDNLGAAKIISFYNLWFRNYQKCQDFLLLRYEDMRQDTKRELRRVLSFLGLKDISDQLVSQAVDYASFSNMKKLEQSQKIKDSALQAANQKDQESFKVRRGKIGGYVDYLSPDDIAYINERVKQLGIEGCDWYYWSKL
jgi:hypothetical protein